MIAEAKSDEKGRVADRLDGTGRHANRDIGVPRKKPSGSKSRPALARGCSKGQPRGRQIGGIFIVRRGWRRGRCGRQLRRWSAFFLRRRVKAEGAEGRRSSPANPSRI